MTATDPTSSAPHRVALGTWPSPLEPAPRLAVALGLGKEDLWFKRDDLVGLGGGGNKTRKLEFTTASALAAGTDTLVTVGAPLSNQGVVLDPTYTGRAMAGLIAAVRDGMILHGQTTVFWHTGGLP
ncbi:hypothetical protein AB0L13_45910 [Saccharopolyspora shandongensis]|uniref:hypothetical protein n=1 Tax=Saccharopolyspora shandongensis TaxID=418495 RepID=UPI00342434D4